MCYSSLLLLFFVLFCFLLSIWFVLRYNLKNIYHSEKKENKNEELIKLQQRGKNSLCKGLFSHTIHKARKMLRTTLLINNDVLLGVSR